MESIDRLRDWLKGRLLMGNGWNELNEIADAIEREAKANRVDAYTKGYDEGFASADDLAAQHEDAMAEHGWVRLPVDAEGEYIRIGDVMEWDNGTFTVHELKVTEDGWTTWDEQHGYTVHADECRHHHAPTVEDVLREFAEKIIDSQVPGVHPTYEEAIAEYAAKLRLAEGVE